MKKICVIGSINYDLVTEVDRIPLEGETIVGKSFSEYYGGKGANQAIAISKLGGIVTFFGKVGNDSFGKKLIENFKEQNVKVRNVQVEDTTSGVAIITVFEDNNRIIVIPGSNGRVDIEYIKKNQKGILTNDIIICQLEIPIETVEYVAEICKENNKIFILNPAPGKRLRADLINNCTYITPNETEITMITENTDSEQVLRNFPNKIILTNGALGIKYFNGNTMVTIESIKVKAIDTTGAGDTFNGAFAYYLLKELPLIESIEFANIAAGISVTKKGAQSGMPKLNEIRMEGEKYGKNY